ncbi:MAG TPA: response regulator [Terrimicrobiaceae bacterium]
MSEGLLISIVDDDESMRRSLRSLLKSTGYSVETFPSGRAFLDSNASRECQCVILDLRMPEMTGREVHLELISSDRLVPVVFITAHGNEWARADLIRLGAVDLLIKPFSENALLGAVRRALAVQR